MNDTKKKALIAFEAEQLLQSEMNEIKGGFVESCDSCTKSCNPGCSSGYSSGTQPEENA